MGKAVELGLLDGGHGPRATAGAIDRPRRHDAAQRRNVCLVAAMHCGSPVPYVGNGASASVSSAVSAACQGATLSGKATRSLCQNLSLGIACLLSSHWTSCSCAMNFRLSS